MQVSKPENLLEVLENEIDYLEHCVDNPFGEFTSVLETFPYYLNVDEMIIVYCLFMT